MSAADIGNASDLRIDSSVDSSTNLVSEQLPLDRRNSGPPGALTALTALRDVCVRIDQRLARAEELSGRRERATMDHTLHDVCAQIYDRLIRVEAALQRTEGYVADKPWDVSTIAYRRLERVEETLRLTQQSLADSTLPEMCVNIERQLIQTRKALQRTEEVVANKRLHELCENINARLVRTENTLRRTEGLVAEWLQELSADMSARFAETEESIQRIERLVSTRTLEQAPPQQPSAQMDSGPLLGNVGPLLRRFMSVTPAHAAARLPWTFRLAMSVLVLVVAVLIGAVIDTTLSSAPENNVSLAATGQTFTPVAPAATQKVETLRVSSTAPGTSASPSTGEGRGSAPTPRSPERESAPVAAPPRIYVGTLLVTSVPPGAVVTINGKAAGVTPLKLPRQRAGSHAVQIAQDGFERWSASVRVPAERVTQVTARLRPIAR